MEITGLITVGHRVLVHFTIALCHYNFAFIDSLLLELCCWCKTQVVHCLLVCGILESIVWLVYDQNMSSRPSCWTSYWNMHPLPWVVWVSRWMARYVPSWHHIWYLQLRDFVSVGIEVRNASHHKYSVFEPIFCAKVWCCDWKMHYWPYTLIWVVFDVLSNFSKLCVHRISFVQHFTRTHLYLEWCVWNMCKNIFGRNILCALQVFLCALVSCLVCAHTRAQLRWNISCAVRCFYRCSSLVLFIQFLFLHLWAKHVLEEEIFWYFNLKLTQTQNELQT